MTVLLVVISTLILLAIVYLIYIQKDPSGEVNSLKQQQALMELSSKLSQEVQEIRKEITDTSGKNREEIQNRLVHINKELLGFQKSTTNTLQSQFDTS